MTEIALFFLVGLLAVAAAIAMLVSNNPVHSALFLIVTMGCIAFLFLLLNAPFLAMIQITVYTGAIMVLFLFVIMLLGSERVEEIDESSVERRYRWYVYVVGGLIGALLLMGGIALIQVNLDLRTDTAPLPQLRVLNAAPDVGSISVTANDVTVASDVAFRDTSRYFSLQPGEYTISVTPTVGDPITTTVSLERGTQHTLVEYGEDGLVNLSLIAEDNSSVLEDHSARLSFFNGDTEISGVRLVSLRSDMIVANGDVLFDGLAPGETSDPIIVPEGTVNWVFVDSNDPDTVLYRLDNYEINNDTSGMVVLTEERAFVGVEGGTLRPLAISVVGSAAPDYGSPEAIGHELFTNYLLVFQVLGILLLAAMVGAIVLTHRQTVSATRKAVGRRRVSRPLVNVIAAQVGHDVTDEGGLPELQEPAEPVGQ